MASRRSGGALLGRVAAMAVAVAIGTSPATGRADAPLLEDGDPRIESANGRFFAVPGPGRRSALVFRREGPDGRVKLWEMKTWPYAGYLDDDGEYFARGDWDVQTLKRGYHGDEVIVSFCRRGELIRSIRLTDVLRRPKNLGSPPEAGYHWGTWVGFVALHRFALDTAEGRRLIYDVTTGALVETVAIRPQDTGDPTCTDWLTQLARGAERRSQAQRRDWMIDAFAGACTGIRVELRDAAVRVHLVRERSRRAEILAAAAGSVLGPACAVPEALADAQKLAASCPLPPRARFHLGGSELSDMRAVDYAWLNAMLKSLIEANEYGDEAERAALVFALSAQLLDEKERPRSSRPQRRPPRERATSGGQEN